MGIRWIAWRIFREITRDRRTLLFFFLAPLVIMTLIYFALVEDPIYKVGLVARGTSRLFVGEIEKALERESDIQITPTGIDDNLQDEFKIKNQIKHLVSQKTLDAVLFLDKSFIEDRFNMKRGELHLYVEGSRPIVTGGVLSAISESLDDLFEALPVVVDESCSGFCAESFNNLTAQLKKHFLYSNEDVRQNDYFFPMFPAFFIFFFTFITSAIIFQRERAGATLERILVSPVPFRNIVVGYIFGFIVFSTAQAAIILGYVYFLIEVNLSVSAIFTLIAVSISSMLIGLLLGLLVSFVSSNEFQVMQMIPLVILPQVFLSDMIWDVDYFPKIFQWISNLMPLTYANTIVRTVVIKGLGNSACLMSWFALGGYTIVLLFLTMRLPKRIK